MPFDPGVALQVKPPELDITKPLTAAAQIGQTVAQTNLLNLQSKVQGAKLNAMSGFTDAMTSNDDSRAMKAIWDLSSIDPEAGSNLLKNYTGSKELQAGVIAKQTGDPKAFDQFPQLREAFTRSLSIADERTRDNQMQNLSVMGRIAAGYANLPRTQKTPQAWNAMLDQASGEGAIPRQMHDQLYNRPNDMYVSQWTAGGMAADKYFELKGNAPRDVGMGGKVVNPYESQNANAPPAPGTSNDGTFPPGPKAPPNAPPTPAGQAQAREQQIYNEIPDSHANAPQRNLPPGTMAEGTDPTKVNLTNEANDHWQKDIVPAAAAGDKQQGELGNIISTLKSGNVSPDTFGNLRQTLAGYVYAMTKDEKGENGARDLAKKITGMDPTSAEVFNKNATRLSFDMSREQGAREAVQVIQFAMAANPNLMQTRQGALQVAELLNTQAQWSKDKGTYAKQWYNKNTDMVGFDDWFNQNHSLKSYMSKVIPYSSEGLKPGEFEHGVTYHGQYKGKPITGTWNGDQGHFENVQAQ